MPELEQQMILMLGFRDMNGREVYLGFLATWGRSRQEAMKFLVERIRSRVQQWKENLLTPVGKEILIKAITHTLPTCVMSVFMIPKDNLQKIKAVTRKFWWGNGIEEKKIYWLSWKNLSRPKN